MDKYNILPDLTNRISEDNEIELGAMESVIIDKVYGPLVYPRLRIRVITDPPGYAVDVETKHNNWLQQHIVHINTEEQDDNI